MSIVSIEPGRTALLHAGLGNVTTRLCRRDDSRGLAARPSFVGAPRVRMPRSEKAEIGHDELVVMFTDGLRRGATLAGDPRAWRSHPGLTARRLGAERTGNDDHLAAVIRCR